MSSSGASESSLGWDTDGSSTSQSVTPGRRERGRYASTHVIFISWTADQQSGYEEHIDKAREAARNFGCRESMFQGNIFYDIRADASDPQQFHRDFNSSLAAANAAESLAVVVYLGGVQYLGGISKHPSSVAHIQPLRTTSVWDTSGSIFILWDLEAIHGVDSDVLFITNFASREFLRCLLFSAPDPSVQDQHRLQLLTFSSNDAERFEQCLSKLNTIQKTLAKSNHMGYSLHTICKRFVKNRVPLRPFPNAPHMAIGEVLRKQVKHVDVRRDIISGTDDIWLTSLYPIFRDEHIKLETEDFYRKASLLVKSPAGSHAEIWKMYLDYQSDLSDPGTVRTTCVVLKRFIPPTSDTTQNRQFENAFRREKDNLVQMMKQPHPNILAMLGSFELVVPGSLRSFNLIFPFAKGSDLATFMRLPRCPDAVPNGPYPLGSYVCDEYSTSEHGVLEECTGLLSALTHLHHGLNDRIIIHRDIKPANILIHEQRFKLADFGASCIKFSAMPSATVRFAGTETYNPPELFSNRGDETSDIVGRARDVWALGCVLLEITVMLAARRHADVVPSVSGFSAIRLRASEERHDEYVTDAFARNMECVRATASLITQLRDKHLTCLLDVAMKMLDENCDTRPQAPVIHKEMTLEYKEMVAEFHPRYEIPSREMSRGDSQTSRVDRAEPDELAHFWYLAFWQNNYDRFYPYDRRLDIPLFILVVLPGSFVAFMAMIKLESSGYPFLSVLSLFLGVPLLGAVPALLVSKLLFSLIPCCLLMRLFKQQAVAYLKPFAAVSGNFPGGGSNVLAYERTQTSPPASPDDRTESESRLNDVTFGEMNVQGDPDVSHSQFRRRWRFAQMWNIARAGANAGTEFGALVQKRICRPLWRTVVYFQTIIDTVANFSAQMENQRTLRVLNGAGPHEANNQTGSIAL